MYPCIYFCLTRAFSHSLVLSLSRQHPKARFASTQAATSLSAFCSLTLFFFVILLSPLHSSTSQARFIALPRLSDCLSVVLCHPQLSLPHDLLLDLLLPTFFTLFLSFSLLLFPRA